MIDSILEESHWVLLIPDLIFSTVLDPGSVYRLSPVRALNNCQRATLKSMLYTDLWSKDCICRSLGPEIKECSLE